MKNKKMKVLLSTLLATNMLLMAPALPVMAEVSESAVMELTAEAIILSADVPLTLPIAVDAQGVVTTPEDVKIINTSPGRIKVKKVTFTETDDWSIKDYDEEFTNYKVNSKNIGLMFNSDKVTATKEIVTGEANWPSINPGENLPIIYTAKVSPQSTVVNAEPTTLAFIIDWDI